MDYHLELFFFEGNGSILGLCMCMCLYIKIFNKLLRQKWRQVLCVCAICVCAICVCAICVCALCGMWSLLMCNFVLEMHARIQLHVPVVVAGGNMHCSIEGT